MNLVPIPQCSFNVSSSTIRRFQISFCSQRSISSCFPSIISSRRIGSREIAARDRVIDFGKYKGKMLGTLPSKYLKWVTKNLRARDFEEWAHLADQVLSDPIYKDRIEWEFAQNLLNGNDVSTTQKKAVSELLEISTRFGWDNDDKLGWRKIDFDMLGTSKGGRIPRLSNKTIGVQDKKATTGVEQGEKLDNRETRRERVRLQRRKNEESAGSPLLQHSTITQTRRNSAPTTSSGRTETTTSRFPGRESLLNKALSLGTSKK